VTLYKLNLGLFLAFLGASLLALVDFRRGFLFTEYSRSPYAAFHPVQFALLAVGAVGMLVCYRLLKSFEVRGAMPATSRTVLAFGAFGLLLIDLFIYRGVPAARAMAAGTVGADWLQAFGVTGWLRPIALSTSYILTVWHATLLGILIAGLALTVLPVYFKPLFSRPGFIGTLAGTLYAIPQPFCSCCAAVMVPAYAHRGASTNFAMSFVVGSPMLNITTIILAFSMLPIEFAATRAAAGIVLTIFVTYGVTRIGDRWTMRSTPGPISLWIERYSRLLQFGAIAADQRVDTPAAIIRAWWGASMRLGLVLVPTLFLWSIVTAAILQLLPAAFGNNVPSVVLAAITGTLLMISTWTEIPVALQLINSGLTGQAATLLVVLPPLSLPCAMLLGGSLGRFTGVIMLVLAVMLSGVLAGVMFL
jgi:uncharacterized membrane protein YraQ (UPF0718 family)